MPGERVVIYTRVSEDRGKNRGAVDRQLQDCLELAERKGLQVVEVVEDNDTSAYGAKPRPGWRRVVEMARQGAIDGIVAYAADRLYRRLVDLEEIIQIVEDRELAVHTVVSGQISLSNEDGRAMARITATLARKESEATARRIARVHEKIAEDGLWKGGKRPWGYHSDGMTAYDVEAQALREVAQDVLAGMNLKAAAARFNELTKESVYRQPVEDAGEVEGSDGQAPRREPPSMSNKVLRDVLISYRVIAKRVRVTQVERGRYARRRTSGEAVELPPWISPDASQVFEAHWDPILDIDTWQALRDKLLGPPGKQDVKTKHPELSLLSGLLKCGECFKERDSSGEPTLVSLGSGAKSYTCGRCGKVGISKTAVEDLILERITDVLEDHNETLPEALELIDPRQRLDRMTKQEQLEQKERDVLKLLDEGLAIDAAREQLLEIRRRRERLTAEDRAEDQRIERRREAMNLLPVWKGASPGEKRLVIAQIAEYFVVDRTGRTGSVFHRSRVRVKWWTDPENADPRPLEPDDEPDPRPEEPEALSAWQARRKKERQARYRAKKREDRAKEQAKRFSLKPGPKG